MIDPTEKRMRWILQQSGRRTAFPSTITGTALTSPMRGAVRVGCILIGRALPSGHWHCYPGPGTATLCTLLDRLAIPYTTEDPFRHD